MANMSKNTKLWILLIFILQLFVAAGFELAHDEAYYWLYSKNLDWGFFDHPPLVAIIIKMFSFLPDSELALRLGFILLQFTTLFILLNLTAYSKLVVWLFFAFPLASFAGLLAIPDMCLLFMTACYCFSLKKYLEVDSKKNILMLSLVIPLLLYAKYHGILLVFFTIVSTPSLLKRPSFYIVFLISFVLFLPHVFWQYQHDFSTLRYHFLERPRSDFSIKRILEYLIAQIGLAGVFVGPIVWKIILSKKGGSAFEKAMKTISVGTVLFFLISTVSKKFEANWTIFLAFPLIYLSANDKLWEKKTIRGALYFSVVVVLFSRILLLVPPSLLEIRRLGEFHGWKDWARHVEKLCGETPILANTYQVASKLSYYLGTEIGALNYQSRKNQFDYWRFERKIPTGKVCYLTDKSQFSGHPVLTPEGKSLRIVKNMSLQELWKLKYQSR